MNYLNWEQLDKLSSEFLQNRPPCPWAHIKYSLTSEGYARLRAMLPAVEGFANTSAPSVRTARRRATATCSITTQVSS